MTIIKWRPGRSGSRFDPFSEMQRLQREMHRIYNTLTNTWGPRGQQEFTHISILPKTITTTM